MFAVGAICAGLLAGVAAGGQFYRLGRLELRFEVWLLGAFLAQGVARGRVWGTSATSWGLVVWVVASCFLMLALSLNLSGPGIAVAMAGTGANIIVTLANSGMPVVLPGHTALRGVLGSGGFYRIGDATSLWGFLGDVLPLRVSGQTIAVSAGDVLLLVGVFVFVAAAVLDAPVPSNVPMEVTTKR